MEMSRIFYCLLGLILMQACAKKGGELHRNKNIEVAHFSDMGFDWLSGSWQRASTSNEKLTREIWHEKNGSLHGIGVSTIGGDTTFREEMDFLFDSDKPYLRIVGTGLDTVLFTITSTQDKSFVAENPENEFPKKIVYQRSNDTLRAQISAGEAKVDFIFIKE